MKVFGYVLLTAALLGCHQYSLPASTQPPFNPTITFPAYGGVLLGSDNGEWGGQLVFEDQNGQRHTLLHDNVRGISQNDDGIFVFTGSDHLGAKRGFLYMIAPTRQPPVELKLIGKLPGTPSSISALTDGSIIFWARTGYSDSKPLLECFELTGTHLKPSNRCPSKPGLGSNNSLKPTLLRGSPAWYKQRTTPPSPLRQAA